MQRRDFLKSSALITAGFSLSQTRVWAQSIPARIEILLDEVTGVIAPEVYGHFTEHIGGVIYDGVWVGEDSKVPNQRGLRSALLEKLKEIKVPVIRWPGGCFADSYDWKDGVGPRSKRPRRTNFWESDPEIARLLGRGPQVFESNAFGTNEFFQFCHLSGAQPYIAANLRSLPALSFDHWVEYCNSPAGSTTLADQRAAAGFVQPFNVRYWGVGNESWGCGGSFTPEDYASEFRRFTTWVPRYGVDLQLIGSGPNDNDMDWTRRFFEKLYSEHVYNNPAFTGWSVHHYAANLSRGKTTDWVAEKGDALRFDIVDWYEVLRQSNKMETILHDQWAVMGEYDREHRVKLVVDEYGPWYREGTEVDPSHLFGQQITIRDALATALTLDIFNRNAEKVSLATCAQLINNINALFLAHEDKFVATPNFYVFKMYMAHQGAQAVRAEFSAPDIAYQRDGKPASFWGLNGSASRKGKEITLTVVNSAVSHSQLTQIEVPGGRIQSGSATVLTATDMHAHNTFEQPDTVKPAKLDVSIAGDRIVASFPGRSVSSVTILLA